MIRCSCVFWWEISSFEGIRTSLLNGISLIPYDPYDDQIHKRKKIRIFWYSRLFQAPQIWEKKQPHIEHGPALQPLPRLLKVTGRTFGTVAARQGTWAYCPKSFVATWSSRPEPRYPMVPMVMYGMFIIPCTNIPLGFQPPLKQWVLIEPPLFT